MGYRHTKSNPPPTTGSVPLDASNAAITSALRKRSSEEIVESEKKIADKKARLEKYGVKFQSAGHLATINENSQDSSLSSYQSILFSSEESSNDPHSTDNSSRTLNNSSNSIELTSSNQLYGGRFVSSSSSVNCSTSKEEETERDKRLSSLPQAKGRKSEHLAAVEAAGGRGGGGEREGGGEEDGSDEEDFVFGRKKFLQIGKPKVKLPVKQMSLKLSDKYESYYH